MKAKNSGYSVTLLFFWLNNVQLAKERVKSRVAEGGHNIPEDVIERRYFNGIYNLFDMYLPIIDGALIFDNSFGRHEFIAHKIGSEELKILDIDKFRKLRNIYDSKG